MVIKRVVNTACKIDWLKKDRGGKGETYEENETGIVIPVSVVLFFEEGGKNCSIFCVSLEFWGIEATCRAPADLVPIRYDIGTGVN